MHIFDVNETPYAEVSQSYHKLQEQSAVIQVAQDEARNEKPTTESEHAGFRPMDTR